MTRQVRVAIGGLLAGVTYGLLARVLADRNDGFAVMTLGFIFVVPLVIGYLTMRPLKDSSTATRIFLPWVACALVIVGSLAGGLEGAICVIFASPVMLVLSSIGGIIGGTRAGQVTAGLPIALALPWLTTAIEARVPVEKRFVTTVTAIEINAPVRTLWPLVVSVDTIRPSERGAALFTSIGFPRPVAATLDHPGVGGVRTASFERGVVFREAVTDWIPGQRIRFTIDATTVPPTALDDHVKIGGPFFDVLTGTYVLAPITPTRTRLILTSEHRISTRFNPYAAFWADRVMRSIQENILAVLKGRAERGVVRGVATVASL